MTESGTPRILVADDQDDVRTSLRLLFKAAGLAVELVASPSAALSALARRQYEVLLMDLNYTRDTTSAREGMDLLRQVTAMPDAPAIVVMTAWGSVELAVEAMRHGARDFIEKPWSNERLLQTVRTQMELTGALRASRRLGEELRALRGQGLPEIVASSPAMQPVLEMMTRVAATDANVLILGENGTGKGLVAQALHASSPRADKPLVTVDVAGLSETVFESELFGHVKGAFTDARSDRTGRIELADGGTLFLDEIANTPSKLQAKLLRVVETGEFEQVGSSRVRHADIRILAATNADIHADAEAGKFRQDLLFRLNTVEIHLPPLRDRREDVTLLAECFLRRHAQRYGKVLAGFDADALKALLDYSWPGNIRELSHVVERAVIMAQGEVISQADLGLWSSVRPLPRLSDMTLEEVERVLIEKALTRHEHNISRAANALGLSRAALYRRLERYGLGQISERPSDQ